MLRLNSMIVTSKGWRQLFLWFSHRDRYFAKLLCSFKSQCMFCEKHFPLSTMEYVWRCTSSWQHASPIKFKQYGDVLMYVIVRMNVYSLSVGIGDGLLCCYFAFAVFVVRYSSNCTSYSNKCLASDIVGAVHLWLFVGNVRINNEMKWISLHPRVQKWLN